jgi:hypothetical protein
MWMKIGIEFSFAEFLIFIPAEHVIDDRQQSVIPFIKHYAGIFLHHRFLHKHKSFILFNPAL